MADVLKVFEHYMKKIGGEFIKIQIDYDRIPRIVDGSKSHSALWQLVSQFVEDVQALVKKNEEQTQGSRPEECHKNNGYGDTNTDKKLTHKDKDYGNKERSSVEIDPSLVQITANKNEMDRRIAAFLKKKRLDVDIRNQREFCNLLNTENEFSCARVDAVFLPRVGQRSHITVTDASRENEIMKSDNITVDTMLHSVPSKREKTESSENLPHGIEERLSNIESHLKTNVKSVQHDVYSRLKQLEEKILYLEGLSPEYFNYKTSSVENASRRFPTDRQPQRWTLQAGFNNDLDERMAQLKEKLLSEKITSRRKAP